MKLTYAVVFEETSNNYSAYAPDLPGCVGTAATLAEAQEIMREAMGIYIEETIEQGEPLPAPQMSMQDALAFHSKALTENADKLRSTFADAPATISTDCGYDCGGGIGLNTIT